MSAFTTTAHLKRMLQARYSSDHVIAFEVSDAAGHNRGRSADAIAVGLWPSRGLRMIGFEIKASRGDWLRELKQPEKAERFVRYCHEWYVVAPSDVIKRDELPPGWGLLAHKGEKLVTVEKSRIPPPAPVPWSLSVCIMRRLFEAATEGRVLAAQELVDKRVVEIEAIAKRRTDDATREANRIRAHADKIKAETGVDLLWGDPNIEAEKIKAAARIAETERVARRAIDHVLRAADRIRKDCPEFESEDS